MKLSHPIKKLGSKTPFFKYVATGNDFILVEDYDESFPLTQPFIKQLCHRKLGIGADGLLIIQNSNHAAIKMRIFNQDGSEATMCGNGLRCIIKHLKKSCKIETKGGISQGEYSNSIIKVTLPKAEVIRENIPLPNRLIGHLVDTGTPHLVIFSEITENQDLAKSLRQPSPFATNGANVNVAQIKPDGIHIRTFEKGLDEETDSCGTGGAAVSLLIHKLHKTNPIKIHFPKTTLTYHFDIQNSLWLEGPAELTFEGNFQYNLKTL
jgi:diaminopimelate epimerase